MQARQRHLLRNTDGSLSTQEPLISKVYSIGKTAQIGRLIIAIRFWLHECSHAAGSVTGYLHRCFPVLRKFRERKSWLSRRPGTQVLDLLFAMLLSLILWRSSLFITVISHPETLTG
jgi:hypothetical protein